MFTKFSEIQKKLFWKIIDELPTNFDDSKEQDIAYLEMKISNNEPLNENNLKVLRHSTLLLRLLKLVLIWKSESNIGECDEEEITKKKNEILNLLTEAEKKKNN